MDLEMRFKGNDMAGAGCTRLTSQPASRTHNMNQNMPIFMLYEETFVKGTDIQNI